MALMMMCTILYSLMRSASYMVSVAREREVSEQLYYAAYSLYTYVKAHIDVKNDTSSASKEVVFSGPWPPTHSTYRGIAWIERKKKEKALLYVEIRQSDNKPLILLSFVI